MYVTFMLLMFTPRGRALASSEVTVEVIDVCHTFLPQVCNMAKSCASLKLSHKTPTTQSPLCGVPQGTALVCLKIKVVEVKQHVYR